MSELNDIGKPVLIGDILNPAWLSGEIWNGWVNAQTHPEFPELVILNYTDKCAHEHHWNNITLMTRGLIYNKLTGEVLARPLRKFFNYGQPGPDGYVAQFSPDMKVDVYDKLDGSLGIHYVRPAGQSAIATRGSFASDQALHATKLFRELFGDIEAPALTWLFEIIYPENRIVLDYGDQDMLVYLGCCYRESGNYRPPMTEGNVELDKWYHGKYRVAEHFGWMSLAEALSLPDRENAEGIVFYTDDGTPWKVKQEDYLALHRVVTNLSRKEVWRQVMAGTYDEWVTKLPDEFMQWADGVEEELSGAANDVVRAVSATLTSILMRVGQPGSTPDWRKNFAMEAKQTAYAPYLFAALDGRDIWRMAFEKNEPKGSSL